MYYISTEGFSSPARVCKSLTHFVKAAQPKEGSRWTVRKRKRVERLDALDTYVVENGKMKKTNEASLFFF